MSLTPTEIAVILDNDYDRTTVLRELKRSVGVERLQEIYDNIGRFTFDPRTVRNAQQIRRTLKYIEDVRRDNAAVFVERQIAKPVTRYHHTLATVVDRQEIFPSFGEYSDTYLSRSLARETPDELTFIDGVISGAIYLRDGLLHVTYLFDGQRINDTVYFFNESIFIPKAEDDSIIYDMDVHEFMQMVDRVDPEHLKLKFRRYGPGTIFNHSELGTFAMYTYFDDYLEDMYDEEVVVPYERERIHLQDFIDRRP